MEEKYKGILPKNYTIDDNYKVLLLIKRSSNTETYRLRGKDGKLYFLKLFKYANLQRSSFDSKNNLLEIEFLKSIKHSNIVNYKGSGELIYNGKKYGFLVLNFITGETLAEKISRETISIAYDIKQIAKGVLNGLNYLHNLADPIIHNEITPQNIMLDMSTDIPKPVIIGFGYARSFHQPMKSFNILGLNLNYTASECFNSLYSPQSDLYSVGVVMYQLMFGLPPWFKDISKFKSDHESVVEIILNERMKPLLFSNIEYDIVDIDETIIKIVKISLSYDPENRFQTASEFIQAIEGEIQVDDIQDTNTKIIKDITENIYKSKAKNKGFEAIAGMQELKSRLMYDVIELINDPEGAEKYNLSMPNGMLLYGPPGCGKTFFAEKFAEETGFGYKYVSPSELGSIYIHGTQEKIGKLFKEAKENAPFIICLDEVSSVFPRRDSAGNHQIGEVDEFLAQLNNCGQDGVFVIALTNYPEIIEEAVLRAGRLDIKVFVPPPDFEARKTLFEIYLKNIPKDFGIDYDKLAKLTENYVSSDIKLIVEEVARSLRKLRGRITMEGLENMIKITNPSVKLSVLRAHEKIRRKFESGDDEENSKDRPQIGFKIK